MRKRLICVAQARVIGGNKKAPHICTISLDADTGELVRTCLPFGNTSDMPVRRWSVFEVKLEKLSADTRAESYFVVEDADNVCGDKLTNSQQKTVHKHLLSLAVPEEQLIEENRSIGVKLIQDIKLHFLSLDTKHTGIRHVMNNKYGLWYSDKMLKVSGKDLLTEKPFNRLLLDWPFMEGLRKNMPYSDLRFAVSRMKYPYLITGTHIRRRRSFMAISVLSSPKPYG